MLHAAATKRRNCTHSSTDRMKVCGTLDPSSILGGCTVKIKHMTILLKESIISDRERTQIFVRLRDKVSTDLRPKSHFQLAHEDQLFEPDPQTQEHLVSDGGLIQEKGDFIFIPSYWTGSIHIIRVAGAFSSFPARRESAQVIANILGRKVVAELGKDVEEFLPK